VSAKQLVFYIVILLVLILCSAFFSSAEAALLSLSRIKLAHRAKKKDQRAMLLVSILEKPEEFLSTVLIGNNLVNVAFASIATYLFTVFFRGSESLLLVTEMILTTLVLLIFAEITPKSYAYLHSESLSALYAYPIKIFSVLFFPFVKALGRISQFFVKRRRIHAWARKEFTLEEIKHFLTHDTRMFQFSPETLKMINEIIDIARKDIKTIMTPRPNIVALEENADLGELRRVIAEKKFSKIPIFRGSMDNITGIVHPHSFLKMLLAEKPEEVRLQQIADKPIFVSEYSSLHFILDVFRRQRLHLAIILDEYGTTIGLITLSDILGEIVSEIEIGNPEVRPLKPGVFLVKGRVPVAEVNSQLEIDLPEKKDYSTLSGLFIFHHGRFPGEGAHLFLGSRQLIVRKMGKRKIDELLVILGHENHHR